MSDEPKCPLSKLDCLKSGCAWWKGDIGACSVWVIAYHLADISDTLEDGSAGKRSPKTAPFVNGRGERV